MVLREFFAKLGLDVDAQSFASGMTAVEGIKFGLNKLVEFGHEATEKIFDLIKETVELGRSAQSTGIATRALQELRGAAEASGVDVDSLNTSVFRLSRSILAAKDGTGNQSEAFAKLGVTLKNADGSLRKTDDVMMSLSDGFKKMPDGAEKTALAIELFGRAGARMIPMLNQGSDELARMRGEAIILDDETIKLGKEANVLLIKLHRMSKRFWDELLSKMLPALITAFEYTIKAGKMVGNFLEFLHKNIKGIIITLGAFTVAWVVMNAASVAAAVAAGAAWVIAFAPVVALFGAVAASVGVILVLMDDLATWAEGGDSMFGEFASALNDWMTVKPGDAWFIVVIKEFMDWIKKAQDALAELMWVLSSPKRIKSAAQGVVDTIGANVEGGARAVGDFLSGGGSPSIGGSASIPSSGGASGSWGPSKVVNNSPNITINQSPGQSAKEVVDEIHRQNQSTMSDANAAMSY